MYNGGADWNPTPADTSQHCKHSKHLKGRPYKYAFSTDPSKLRSIYKTTSISTSSLANMPYNLKGRNILVTGGSAYVLPSQPSNPTIPSLYQT